MNIGRALKLKIGDIVHCPADRGDPAYSGYVTHITNLVVERPVKFIWVEVEPTYSSRKKNKSVWPSNRLG